jgi:hypothetical protein
MKWRLRIWAGRSVMVLALGAAVLSAGCGSFFIGLGFLLQCGPMPMSPDDCKDGRGWGLRPDPPTKDDARKG